jgi:DNA-binding HxlR family transcriptional regulator
VSAHCEALVADCRVRLATDLLAHTWDPVVLLTLRTGPRRRMELLSDIGGISDKALSETLRRLRRSGLLIRLVASDRSVAYGLSEVGVSLATGPLVALGQWATEHGDHVLAHQLDQTA